MGVHSVQIALNATTATPLVVPGPGAGGADTSFINVQGSIGDPLPVMVTNLSSTIVVYVGGLGVTSSTGTPIQPLASLPFSFVGTDATFLAAIAASATPSVAVMALR